MPWQPVVMHAADTSHRSALHHDVVSFLYHLCFGLRRSAWRSPASNQVYHAGQFVTSSIGNIVQITAGGFHVLVLNDQGRLYTFGANNEGQLGHPGTGLAMPVGLENVTIANAAGGEFHSLAVSTTGVGYSWGAGWVRAFVHRTDGNLLSCRR